MHNTKIANKTEEKPEKSVSNVIARKIQLITKAA